MAIRKISSSSTYPAQRILHAPAYLCLRTPSFLGSFLGLCSICRHLLPVGSGHNHFRAECNCSAVHGLQETSAPPPPPSILSTQYYACLGKGAELQTMPLKTSQSIFPRLTKALDSLLIYDMPSAVFITKGYTVPRSVLKNSLIMSLPNRYFG